MIMVPPILKIHNMPADQKLAKPSLKGRVPITAKDMIINVMVNPKIEYLLASAALAMKKEMGELMRRSND